MRVLDRPATLADAVLPTSGQFGILGQRIPATLVRDIALIVGFAILVAVCGRIRFFLPDNDFPGSVNPIPVTLTTFGVLVTGAALGSWRGLCSLALFYLVGMAGMPVFQGGNSGWEYVTGSATGGFLIGFVVAAYVTGFLAERGWNRSNALWALLVGNIVIYIPGLLWLGAQGFVPWSELLSKGLYPFIPGDLLKLVMAGIALPAAWALARRGEDTQ